MFFMYICDRKVAKAPNTFQFTTSLTTKLNNYENKSFFNSRAALHDGSQRMGTDTKNW